jgi:hypothetical protein
LRDVAGKLSLALGGLRQYANTSADGGKLHGRRLIKMIKFVTLCECDGKFAGFESFVR